MGLELRRPALVAGLSLAAAGGCGEQPNPSSSRPAKSGTVVELAAQTSNGVRARVRVTQTKVRDCVFTTAETSGTGAGGKQGISNRLCGDALEEDPPHFVLIRAHGRPGGLLVANFPKRCSEVGVRAPRGYRATSAACHDVNGERLAMLVLPPRTRVIMHGLGELRRFAAGDITCSRAQGLCMTELDAQGEQRG